MHSAAYYVPQCKVQISPNAFLALSPNACALMEFHGTGVALGCFVYKNPVDMT